MAITREKVLRGYETDIINGNCFAIYDNNIVEDGVIISSKRHRENMDLNTIEELKKSAFVDHALLTNANKLVELQSDKMILSTEILTHKEAIKAHEENFKMAKTINDEIYAENKKLKADKEKLLSDMVKLDENIINLNAQIVASKKVK